MPATVDKASKEKLAKRALSKVARGRYEVLSVRLTRKISPQSVVLGEYLDPVASRRFAEMMLAPPEPTEALQRLMQDE